MPALERPRLRSHLTWETEGAGGYVIRDQLRLAVHQLRLTHLEMSWLRLFDGQRTLPDIQSEALRYINDLAEPVDVFRRFVRKLDDALFFDGPRFRSRLSEHAGNPIRPPACLACYDNDPVRLRRSLARFFTGPGGPGRPGPRRPEERFRAALIPHIDYGRGGYTYAWAYKEVLERCPASLFVIIGTSHYSYHRFTLTRKHFQTPLGIALTDQTYIDRLAAHYGDGLFDDEFAAHLPEHSIELEVIFLQYLYPDKPFRIVPLVVGSFRDCVLSGHEPDRMDDIGRMIAALKAAERETKEPICYIISGDLAHIGPKFRDPRPVNPTQLTHSRRQDLALLHELGESANGAASAPRGRDALGALTRSRSPDPSGYFRVIAEEHDARRICGLPPTYIVLKALQPSRGEVLHYDQYVHPEGYESVSFASVVFYK
ncbi:MAG TPA: AmmeMemoRadiSam system protein B [Gemmataceae bacterium]|nr:AmmeMemoRadiSam system protein B [Gemmataceae bacterium]